MTGEYHTFHFPQKLFWLDCVAIKEGKYQTLMGYLGTGAFIHCNWGYKLVQTLCKTVQLVLNLYVPYDAQMVL